VEQLADELHDEDERLPVDEELADHLTRLDGLSNGDNREETDEPGSEADSLEPRVADDWVLDPDERPVEEHAGEDWLRDGVQSKTAEELAGDLAKLEDGPPDGDEPRLAGDCLLDADQRFPVEELADEDWLGSDGDECEVADGRLPVEELAGDQVENGVPEGEKCEEADGRLG